MPTPNLGVPLISAAQNNKYQTHNDGVTQLDNAANGLLVKAVTGATTLTAAEFTNSFVFRLTGSMGAAWNLTVPTSKRCFIADNQSGNTVTVKYSASTGVAVPTGQKFLLYADGTDVAAYGGGGGAGSLATLTDVALSSPTNNQFLRYVSATSKWSNVTVSGATITPFVLSDMASSTQYNPSGGYTAGTVLIMKNGSLLTPGASGDFTATNGTNVNFSVAVKSGDQLLYISLPAIGGVAGGGSSKDVNGAFLANNPTTSGFTLTQSSGLAGNATMSNLASGRGFNIVVPCQSAADNNAFVNRAVPGGSSWSMTALIVPMVPPGNASNYSLAVRDASGKFVLFGFDGYANRMAYGKWSDINTFTGRINGPLMPFPVLTPVWMKLDYTSGGNFVFSMSSDGETFAQVYSISVTDYIGTPTLCGIWLDHNLASSTPAQKIAASVMSFTAA